MKPLEFINLKIKQWHHHQKDEDREKALLASSHYQQHKIDKDKDTLNQAGSPLLRFICHIHPPAMLMMTIISLTGVVSYRYYNQPELAVGTVSPTKIVAPEDGSFEDLKTTEELRKKTRTGLLPVLQQNPLVTDQINLALAKKINEIEKARQISGYFPFLNTGIVSTSMQIYLQQISEPEWREIVTLLNSKNQLNFPQLSARLPKNTIKALQELSRYRDKVEASKFNSILVNIAKARERHNKALAQILPKNIDNLSNQEKETLILLSAQNWNQTKRNLQTGLERILTQGIPPGLPDQLKEQTVKIQLEDSLPFPVKAIAYKILYSVLEPNLIIDELETKNRAEKAAQAVKPVMVSIKKGEVIVDVGAEITQSKFVLLDNFGLSRRGTNWKGVGLSLLLVSGSLIVFGIVTKKSKKNLRKRDQILLWLLTLTVPVIAIFDVHYTSLPAVGFLISSFYGPLLAATNVSLITGLVLFETGSLGWEYLVASYAGAMLASLLVSRLHSREELALLGAGVGFTQGGVYLVITLIISATAGTIWYAVLPPAILYGLVGVGCCVVALGISPYLERFFDLITPIRLAELSNTNRPLLKKLATEAPGTFQHTMFVASLAEAAARALHCNVELVRAGTLYHDIGKMHDPKGFIENQMGGPNKHDTLNNPWISAEIIKKHVAQGLLMARQYGLPKAIQDFIPEHQGTLLISYFFFQAKAQAEEDPTKRAREEDFRYDGPIPQSRETGIVMLADGCEAALRSLKDATPEQALIMVQKIFKARWRDHQLAESGIKYEELPVIANIFIQVWQQFNHQRIVYPKAALDYYQQTQKSI
jgi:putative nucleotidyltransferase with HDIG domain